MEAIQKKARNVKWTLGQLEKCRGLLQVTAPLKGSNNTRITYVNKEQIKLEYLEEAHRCFTQAAEMPILQQPMAVRLGLADINLLAFNRYWTAPFSAHQHVNQQQNVYFNSWHAQRT